MTSNNPFSPRRARADLVAALPALGMFLGAVTGVLVGLTRGVGGPVSMGGVGLAAGLLVGWLLRIALAPGGTDPE
jgi:hypothetical protein